MAATAYGFILAVKRSGTACRKARVAARLRLLITLFILASCMSMPGHALAGPLSQEQTPTAADLIGAVNALRQASGLPALRVHPVLMQVAAWEVAALADSGGASSHVRPPGMTLGQQLLALGYPLSGDLSLDGYRSENIIWGPGLTAQTAVQSWLGDDPHTNTMLSVDRSDIGAAVAISLDEWGLTVHYLVIETALQTRSGQMQYDAYPILTAIASNQAAFSGADPSASGALPQQYIVPVVRSTARSDGDVIHKVQYGQSLWSIAMAYGTTINQIRAWNNLATDASVYVGQILLVQKAATQPSPPTITTPAPTVVPTIATTPTHSATAPIPVQSTPGARAASEAGDGSSSTILILILIIALVGAGAASVMLRMPK